MGLEIESTKENAQLKRPEGSAHTETRKCKSKELLLVGCALHVHLLKIVQSVYVTG